MFSENPTKDVVEHWNEKLVPLLSEEAKVIESSYGGDSFDILRQEYTDLMEVPTDRYLAPYESVYRERRMMGKSAALAKKFYLAVGVELNEDTSEPPDHISLELDFMRILCEKEARAWKNSEDLSAGRYLTTEEQFLSNHLAGWASELCDQMRDRARTTFYKSVASITKKFLALDLEEVRQSLKEINSIKN